ncbi:beta-ketoacyl-[acyl-carrier-protein] synthase family protein [Limibaculum sp. FT325]|uniref:beta-ketoacyl-[acyl-carrier-protein] synthase family protein n=1 Tax=Thermohalobaculum sediminis TaxID=2939436 RepID=UPI0020BFC0B4|nr:beta-ketoacyl-[acyl-carrier-protein] synthase family protein [Limibaculum sediminis]MCL5778850.1 beta-ketoacyl-[acyl-carrier-protein] synthase family protein [Limibaculum sediminis]
MHRVVVTGLGVVSALGVGRDAHFAGLAEGRCGIGPIGLIDPARLMIKIAAEARDFRGEDRFDRQDLLLLDRITQMAVVAMDEAKAQSGIEFDEELGLRTATIIATAMGGLHTCDENYRTVYQEQKNRVHPFIIPRLMANAPVSQISMRHGLKGPAWSVSTACASSNHAIGQAFHMVRAGVVDAAVTGGTESVLCFGGIKAWEGLRVMSQDGCRPFSANRNGMVLGEGCAILILERLDRAIARGAPILGEIAGAGATADAADIVAPAVEGAARAMTLALADARIAPDEVGYINAHGTATALNDRTEAAAVRLALGEAASRVMVSSTKSMHGHAIGAAGALEAAAVLMALGQGIVPPTINHEAEDPEIGLDVVPNQSREAQVDAALSNAFAFGGLNAVLAFRRWKG